MLAKPSEKNILKVVRPLFLDALHEEFEQIKALKKGKKTALQTFHTKLGILGFLDPACGCGNFLVVSFRELKELELQVVLALRDEENKDSAKRLVLDVKMLSKVSINQFYGIEMEEFPVEIARVSMWLMEHVMNVKFGKSLGCVIPSIPLHHSAEIICTNALATPWENVVAPEYLHYILGNPPFKGFKYATDAQKKDMQAVFGEICKTALLDYVCAWYKIAAEYIQGTKIECAFVSTNSIVQGTQAGKLWGILIDNYHIVINFAYRSFKWSNEAKSNAAVHCVIVCFSQVNRSTKILVKHDNACGKDILISAKRINPYLLDAENIVVTSRSKPLCNVPDIVMGNQAMDGGNLIIDVKYYTQFLEKEPLSAQYIKKYMMGHEFLNGNSRYCLWLKDCPSSELSKMPHVMERVRRVKQMRASSTDAGARRLSESPTLFRERRNPNKFIAIPITSSEIRKYIPIGYLGSDTIAGNTLFILEDATLYHLGILTSEMHMAWMRVVGARLKSDYRYSKDIVYNNFPWPARRNNRKKPLKRWPRLCWIRASSIRT